jgi:hypothetical protein
MIMVVVVVVVVWLPMYMFATGINFKGLLFKPMWVFTFLSIALQSLGFAIISKCCVYSSCNEAPPGAAAAHDENICLM